MQRVGFIIQVRPEKLEAYRKLHNPIWPELAAELKAAGIRNYTLWLRKEDGLEFGYLECDDWEATCRHLEASEVHSRWQTMMSDYLVRPKDNLHGDQPVTMLEQIFTLE